MYQTKRPTSAVFVVATAAIGVGLLSGCGSNNASDQASSPAATESSSRTAGESTRPVHLTVTNKTNERISTTKTSTKHFDITMVLEKSYLAPNASFEITENSPGAWISRTLTSPRDYFVVVNPSGVQPYIAYSNKFAVNVSQYQSKGLGIDDAFTWESPTSGLTYVIKRGDDTDTKNVTITVK